MECAWPTPLRPAIDRWRPKSSEAIRGCGQGGAYCSSLCSLSAFVSVPLTLVRSIAHLHRSQTAIAPLPDLLQETSLLGGLFLATLIMARIERRSVFSYGFQDERKLTRLVSGTIVGFLVVSGLVGLLWITGALAFDGISIHSR